MARTDWRRVVTEGAVIVASILLAFAIDAAWDNRREREVEAAMLLGLSSDFDAVMVELDRVSARHSRSRSAAQRLMAMGLNGPVSPDSAFAVDSLLATTVVGATFDAPSGTLDALVGSGSLELLRNTELVSALTAWASEVEDLQQSETYILEHGLEVLGYLNTRINTIPLPLGGVVPPSTTEQATLGYRLVAEREFLNHMRQRAFFYDLVIADANRVRESLRNIQAQLDKATSR